MMSLHLIIVSYQPLFVNIVHFALLENSFYSISVVLLKTKINNRKISAV